MDILLKQALMLTIIGMGMTFAAIGLLVVGMYAMTAFIKDKADDTETVDVVETPDVPADAGTLPVDRRHQHIAASAAVATMLAAYNDNAQLAAAAAVSVAFATQPAAPAVPSTAPSAWNTVIRGQHLAQRTYHSLQRKQDTDGTGLPIFLIRD